MITAFRTSIDFATLVELLVRTDSTQDRAGKPFSSNRALEKQLRDLENRGLLGCDRQNVDLHPIIRASVWRWLKNPEKAELLEMVAGFADSKLQQAKAAKAPTGVAVKWAIEQFYALIGLWRWSDAYRVFADSLDDILYYLLSRGRDRQDLLDHLLRKRPGEYRQVAGTTSVDSWFEKEPQYHALILYRYAKGAMFLGDTESAVASFDAAYKIVDSLPPQKFDKPEQPPILAQTRLVNTTADVASWCSAIGPRRSACRKAAQCRVGSSRGAASQPRRRLSRCRRREQEPPGHGAVGSWRNRKGRNLSERLALILAAARGKAHGGVSVRLPRAPSLLEKRIGSVPAVGGRGLAVVPRRK